MLTLKGIWAARLFLTIGLSLSTIGISVVSAAESADADAVRLPYAERQEVRDFIARMAAQHDYDAAELRRLFAAAEYKQSIIDAITRPAEKRLQWWEYRNIFLKPDRIEQGIAFWQQHDAKVRAISDAYAVDPEVIIAVVGVETKYGRIAGSYRVLDALMTLAFDYPSRARFFRSELENFLLFSREERQDPLKFKGSYAGAMGYGQFIPSSYRNYAVDFDGDGRRDIWKNVGDALASVANYLHVHGWQPQADVVHEVAVSGARYEKKVNQGVRKRGLSRGATLPEFHKMGIDIGDITFDRQRKLGLIRLDVQDGAAYWLAEHNFYVITTYNTSRLYAMAVYDLSREILKGYCQTATPNNFVRAYCAHG